MRAALRLLLFSSLLLAMNHPLAFAQSHSGELSPALQQHLEAQLRSMADFPPETALTFKILGPSELSGFDRLSCHYASALDGTSGNISLLISQDRTHIAQAYDIAADPRTKVPSEGRPSRGGPPTAPVLLVSFDDLECPFCAQLHKELFPALTDHYKNQVRVVYQSLPNDGHPWSMHAAVDTDCLGKESPDAYWAAVDTIHSHAPEYGGTAGDLALAERELDTEVLDEGRRFHVAEEPLQACIEKQDTTPEKESVALASRLGVTRTPTIFVNGAKSEGIVPVDFIFNMVDTALRAEGQVPPPRPARKASTAIPLPQK
ncbi:MAG TPA: thioredoxin domain-containing protein [Acidobacteriaceae bacterium]|nr:thioredoxin domain-containing protein [Acidobacteriaceae bacterium]